MTQLTIRLADPTRDAAACAAIYAPNVEASPTSFEERAPGEAELATRIERTLRAHPWLVAESGGAVIGYAYACPHRERLAYRWAVDVSVYVAEGERGQGAGQRPATMFSMSENETPVLAEDDVLEALEEVIDPELGLDFVSLGLVYDIEIEGEEVFVTFTLTTPACPIGPQVSEQMKEFVGDLPGVAAVHPKMVFDPPWSPEMMTEDAKFALGF